MYLHLWMLYVHGEFHENVNQREKLKNHFRWFRYEFIHKNSISSRGVWKNTCFPKISFNSSVFLTKNVQKIDLFDCFTWRKIAMRTMDLLYELHDQ